LPWRRFDQEVFGSGHSDAARIPRSMVSNPAAAYFGINSLSMNSSESGVRPKHRSLTCRNRSQQAAPREMHVQLVCDAVQLRRQIFNRRLNESKVLLSSYQVVLPRIILIIARAYTAHSNYKSDLIQPPSTGIDVPVM
jgi:hypothetical protein